MPFQALKELFEVEKVKNFVNGKFVEPTSQKWLENVKPATNEVWCKFPDSNEKDVNTAVAAAKAALPAWRKKTPKERAKYLRAIGAEIMRDRTRFAELEMHDTGKNFPFANQVDIPRAAANFEFFANLITTIGTDCHNDGNGLNYTERKPVGVCGLITPWNLPLLLLSFKVAPALACGNTVVAKPSNITPMTADALAAVCAKVGLPPGVFNVVHGAGQSAGAPLVAHKDVRAISFTGGEFVGKIIGAQCGKMFKKLQLELGGKNPGIVFKDCDFKKTIPNLTKAAFSNQGQVCLTIERLFVQREIMDDLIKAWKKHLDATLVVGDPATSNYGSLVGNFHRDKVEEYIELAKKEGGKIVYGGTRPNLPAPFDKGAFILPTLVTGLSHKSKCATEEVFGPFVTIHPFDTEEEALEMANYVDVGLASSVWTQDINKAHRVASKLETGMTWVNGWCIRDVRVPFGGVKESGVGREGGMYSIDFYTQAKNICINVQSPESTKF